MAIEQVRTVDVLGVELGDGYAIEVTARDVFTGVTVVVALNREEAHAHVEELLAVIAEAADVRPVDSPAVHGFDVDVPVCRDCREGKHGACIGSAYVENGSEIDEVECRCTADGHRGRS